ncbi:MAG: type II secretion system protein, partial [Planctomycetes bacterium]|nr:type II secretion system protein [Planctomycetota bacterium]
MRGRAIQSGRSSLPYGRGLVRRRGFTIIELIVSIGLLALMMSLAGKVFSISVASTGQATALIEVSQSFRLLGATLRDDLRSINPERSMLVIAANPINAYWTAEGRELDSPANSGDGDPSSGYLHDADPEREDVNRDMVPPRADVLMTFTSRKAHSVRYPSIWSNIVQVVYGHAELGELDGAGNWVGGIGPDDFGTHDPTIGIAFPTPASEWHLARRSVLIVDAAEASL